MLGKDRKNKPAGDDEASGTSHMSRRSMLGAAGVGAAGVAAGALGAGTSALAATRPAKNTSQPQAKQESPDHTDPDEPVVIHVRDAHSGELDVFAGESHTKLQDPDLAARLRRAAR